MGPMPDSDKSFPNPFRLVFRLVTWFFNQFPDTVLIAMSVLAFGLMIIGSLYLVGHLTPKQPAVNIDHVYHEAYKHELPRVIHQPHVDSAPPVQQVHGGHFSYPQSIYHQSPSGRFHHYNHHLSYQEHGVVEAETTESSPALDGVHSSRLSPYATHRFGRPRSVESSESEATEGSVDKTFDYFRAGKAHAYQY